MRCSKDILNHIYLETLIFMFLLLRKFYFAQQNTQLSFFVTTKGRKRNETKSYLRQNKMSALLFLSFDFSIQRRIFALGPKKFEETEMGHLKYEKYLGTRSTYFHLGKWL